MVVEHSGFVHETIWAAIGSLDTQGIPHSQRMHDAVCAIALLGPEDFDGDEEARIAWYRIEAACGLEIDGEYGTLGPTLLGMSSPRLQALEQQIREFQARMAAGQTHESTL